MVVYELEFKTNTSSSWKLQETFQSAIDACHLARRITMREMDNINDLEHISVLRVIKRDGRLRRVLKTFKIN